MSAIRIISFIALAMVLFSCEKVIDVKLKDGDPKINVEGFVMNGEGNNYVKLTRSASYFSSNNFEPVTAADVTITDGNGAVYILTESQPGNYTNAGLEGIPGTTYSLRIETGDEVLTSSSTMPVDIVPLEDLYYSPPGYDDVFVEDDESSVTFSFFDPEPEFNYYRVRSFINGEPSDGLFGTISQDFFTDGYYEDGVADIMESGDEVEIRLFNIDKANYDFFLFLENSEGAGGDPTSAAPGNPDSNIEGGIGIFGAYTTSSATIVVP